MTWIDLFLIRLEVAMTEAGIKRFERMRVHESMRRALA